jgi:hypothetical protein
MRTKILLSLSIMLTGMLSVAACGGSSGASLDSVCGKTCDCIVATGLIPPSGKAGCVSSCKMQGGGESQSCLDCINGLTCQHILANDSCQAQCGGGDGGTHIDSSTGPDGMSMIDAAGGGPDAAGGGNAADLGMVCTSNATCGTGGMCITLKGAGATSGFCSIDCTGGMDTTTCSNGFPGPGMPACALQNSMTGTFLCAVRCTNAATGCPTGTTCQDLFGATGKPCPLDPANPTTTEACDGMKDFCSP